IVQNADGDTEISLDNRQLRQAMDLLTQLDELVGLVTRRGIDFAEFLSLRSNDPEGNNRLPRIRLEIPGRHDQYFWSDAEEEAYRAEHNLHAVDPDLEEVIGDEGDSAPSETTAGAKVYRKELHEVKDLEQLFGQLAALGLSIDDYALTQEETASGETLPTRYVLQTSDGKGNDRPVPVVNLAGIVPAVLESGKHGLEIKRFKGLGEMDAEQLWETTMDPSQRVLLRVTWDSANQAEQLFGVLMGEEVEPRRKYIEDHALEVKNLDV
ncbi:MAG: hypothetical protein MJA83_14820, partial [Gammaproteobacteria bacterium]|nr:hypothetical protein [Gammaproteobacteria bacterium]